MYYNVIMQLIWGDSYTNYTIKGIKYSYVLQST